MDYTTSIQYDVNVQRNWKILLWGASDRENRLMLERLRGLPGCQCRVDVVLSSAEASQRIAAENYDAYLLDYDAGKDWIADQEANGHQRATLFLIEKHFDPEILAEDFRTYVFYIFKNRIGLAEVDVWEAAGEQAKKAETFKKTLLFRSLSRAIDISHDFEALRESEERFRKLVENAQDGIAVVLDQKIAFINRAMLDMFGLQREEEMVGHRVAEFLVPKQRDYVEGLNVRRQRGEAVPSRYEVLCTRSDGTVFEVEVAASTFHHKGRIASIAILRDISLRLEAERALRESEERFRTLVERASDGICVVQDGLTKYVNPSACELIGYSAEELVGHRSGRFVDSQDSERANQLHQQHISGEKSQLVTQMRMVHRDGHALDLEISVGPVIYDGKPATLAFVRDLTERKRFEETVRQAQKIQAIAVLAAGISHNFNNLLYVIRGNTELLAREMNPAQAAATEYANEILTAVQRASEMVSQVLTFGRQTEQQFMPFLIQPILKESLRLIENSTPEKIAVRQNVDPNCHPVFGDPTQIHQMIMNLCANACEAMQQQGGELSVSLSETALGSELVSRMPKLRPGLYVHLQVVDTGIGMDDATRQQIFDPFFTAKRGGIGAGLGLSMVHGIVESHGGMIEVTSRVGFGTTFDVYLPCYLEPTVLLADEEENTALAEGTERVLFVDDEAPVASLGTEALRRLGYCAEGFSSSKEALRAFCSAPNQFDVVITDLTMPDMSGVELAAKIRRIRPDIPIIFCSGYTEPIQQVEREKTGFDLCLRKPITSQKLGQAIQKLLRQAAEQ